MVKLAEVPLRNVVYSFNPRSSDTQKSRAIIMARTTKAVGENAPAFQTRANKSTIDFMGWQSFPKVVRARWRREALHPQPGCWHNISTGRFCAKENLPYRGLRSRPGGIPHHGKSRPPGRPSPWNRRSPQTRE